MVAKKAMRDYYEILGVPKDAGADAIKHACRRLARRYHPDISADERSVARLEMADASELRDAPRRRNDDARASARDADWLADEVAIDFPSIEAVVDRIRDAFFGPEVGASRLSADVVVSAREAFCGATVPIEVPLRRTCAACGGRGEIWAERCAGCGGSGEALAMHPVHLSVPAGVRDGARLRLSIAPPHAPDTVVELRVAIR
jgi:molecular chaperone DnaJ